VSVARLTLSTKRNAPSVSVTNARSRLKGLTPEINRELKVLL
jgi:hypothetical protein